MNVIARPKMSVEDFLAWEQEQEFRNEFDGETIIPMNGESRQHNRLSQRLNMLLAAQIDLTRFEIITAGVQFRVGNTVRYPDLMVAPLPSDVLSHVLDPVFVLEVISPSSVKQDTVVKPLQYQACPALQHYLFVQQTRAEGTVWHRHGDGWKKTPVSAGSQIALGAIGADVRLDDLYSAPSPRPSP